MVEIVLIAVFSASIFVCLCVAGTVLPALLFGFVLFFAYGLAKGKSCVEMLISALSGVKSSAGVLVVLVLVGALTATWRASGTMAYMAEQVVRICPAPLILLMTFLLCSLVSFLIGSAFATAATVGTICVIVATSADVSVVLAGGAVLSGSYFGDRCSAVSGSALLVASLTGTKVTKNMRAMVKTSVVPFALTCVLFCIIGVASNHGTGLAQAPSYLGTCYTEDALCIVPAVAVLVLALCGLPCYVVLGVGALLGGIVAVCVQGCAPLQVLESCVFGYVAQASAASSLSGGGMASMALALAIIFISSCYAGMFEKTGMLLGVERAIEKVDNRAGLFAATLVSAVLSSVCACNQTLAIILTHQLCKKNTPDAELLASNLENTVVTIAACVPFSTAAAVPLAAIGAPYLSILVSFYLYLVPIWNACVAFAKKRRSSKDTSCAVAQSAKMKAC